MIFERTLRCRCHSGNSSEAGALPRHSKFFITEARSHHPPDRLVDVTHIRLDIRVDLKTKTLEGKCTTDYCAIAPKVSRLRFDAIDLRVQRVLDGHGALLRFDQNEREVSVFFEKEISTGDAGQIIFEYKVVEPRAGLYFIAPDEHYPDRPWQLWTQGQDQDNRYWFPCHDAPNEKASTEMTVTVDEKFTAISNGALCDMKHDAKTKTRTFHWKQAIPHASYLVTLCVGEFVELKDKWRNSKGEEIPVQYFTLKGREDETLASFEKTPKMMDFFSQKIGVDYPYEKYAQVVAWDFIYGGMENTSSTTQMEATLHPRELEQDYSSEYLVAHELAHQWFGDLLTCKSWSQAWLNEGFATYFESLWTEREHGRDEFLYELFQYEGLYKSEDAGYRRPIVTNVYISPTDIFDRHLYEKGARVLHMLRDYLGDETWWRGIQTYVSANVAQTVETVDLQRAMESVSGRSLGWFFEQWVYKAGHPDIKASSEWDETKKQIKLTVAQKQKEDELTSIFRLPLKFKVVTSRGETVHDCEITGPEQGFTFECPEKPRYVSLNPGNPILGKWDFKPGMEMLRTQLVEDEDVMGRIFAARALAKDASRETVEALARALKAEKFWGLQIEIAESLGLIGTELARETLLEHWAKIKHPKARKSAIRALGMVKTEKAIPVFEAALDKDASPLVQYEAGLALGKLRHATSFDRLNKRLGKRKSWHDYHDRGILAGLAQLRMDERVLPVLLDNTKRGLSMYVRRDALLGLAGYAQTKPALVLEPLADLMRDENYFVKASALGALESLGDDRAIGSIRGLYDRAVDPRLKRSALEAMKAIRDGGAQAETLEKLQADLDRVKEQYREVLSRLEKVETGTRKPEAGNG